MQYILTCLLSNCECSLEPKSFLLTNPGTSSREHLRPQPRSREDLWTRSSSANTSPQKGDPTWGCSSRRLNQDIQTRMCRCIQTFTCVPGVPGVPELSRQEVTNRLAAPAPWATAAASWAPGLAPSFLFISTHFRALELQFVEVTLTHIQALWAFQGLFQAKMWRAGREAVPWAALCLPWGQILSGLCSSKITRREVKAASGEMQSQRCQALSSRTQAPTMPFAAFQLFPLPVIKDKEVETRKEM